MTKITQKLFCKTALRSFVLALGLIAATGLNANPESGYSGSGIAASAPQDGTVRLTGRVTDENNAGVGGANIQIKGNTRGIITDTEGSFSIEAAPSDVLIVSCLGYVTQEIPVGDRRNIPVQMVPVASELDEVTIVAYGSQRKESIVGAINTIDYRQLNISTGQLSTSLAGKLAGVVVMQRTGEPGAGADFWIRGVSTFGTGNNKPLVLVDGIERSMDLVDSYDIATFSILKDATATAVYGVRGANGIVLITTKRGIETRKPKIDIKAEFGMTQPVKLPSMANTEQWLDYYDELHIDSSSGQPAFTDYERQMYLSGADPDLYPSVDWIKTIYKNMARTGRINASVTGGTKQVRYYVATSYYTEGGIFNMADKDRYDAQLNFNKFNFRSNVDINVTSSTELGISLSTQYTTKNSPGNGDLGSLYSYTMLVTPIATPTIFSDGSFARPAIGHNPYYYLNNVGYARINNMIAQSLLSLTQDFSEFVTPGLKANVKFAMDAQNQNHLYRTMSPTTYHAAGRDAEGNLILESNGEGTNHMTLASGNSGWTTINFEASLLYERLFARQHRLSAMFLYSVRSKSNNNPGTQYDLAFPYRNMGLAGRATYAFRDKYFAEVNFGYNGSENFAPGKRFGFFPSYAVGYMISNEQFWEPIRETVDHLKIRTSYGKIGNDQIGGDRRFAYNTTINTSASGFTFGRTQGYYGGITTDEFGNPAVAWEEATKFDVGIEFGLFYMFKAQVDYFSELREGIFIRRESTPSVIGLNKQQWVNYGRMRNRGFDFSLEFERHFTKDFYFSARGNFTYNRNQKLYDDKPDQIWKYQNKAGFANDQQFGLIAEGLFESEEDIATWSTQSFGKVRPGDIKYRDINGDGIVNSFDMVAIGYTTIPEINYGFGVSMSYKGIDFSLFFSGVGNVTRIIDGANLYGASNNIINTGQIYEDVALNRWTLDNQNPNAPYPRLSLEKMDNNMQASTYWQRDMSFLRLKNAEIGYTLPSRTSEKMGLSTLRIYLQGVNLLTFTEFKLWDPELNASYGNVYPLMRNVTLGLNLSF